MWDHSLKKIQTVQNSRVPLELHGYMPGLFTKRLPPLLGCHCSSPHFLLAYSLLEKKAPTVVSVPLVTFQEFLPPIFRDMHWRVQRLSTKPLGWSTILWAEIMCLRAWKGKLGPDSTVLEAGLYFAFWRRMKGSFWAGEKCYHSFRGHHASCLKM